MDDRALLDGFESQSLAPSDWDHRAHVRVAYLYLSSLPFEEALLKIREGIQRLNARLGVEDSPTGGYNETTTHAFLHLIASTMRVYGDAFPVSDSEGFCENHPQLMTRHVLRLFYSPARRMDSRTKTEFVEPDLAPLPKRQ